MFGSILKKFGTESYGISGTFSALALLCANVGVARSVTAMARRQTRQRFIDPPGCWRESIPDRRSSHGRCGESVEAIVQEVCAGRVKTYRMPASIRTDVSATAQATI